MASMFPWNRPGASGDPTSAMTSTVMSVGVTPTSVACRVVLPHWEDEFVAVPVVPAGAVAGAAAGLLVLPLAHPPARTRIPTEMTMNGLLRNSPPCGTHF